MGGLAGGTPKSAANRSAASKSERPTAASYMPEIAAIGLITQSLNPLQLSRERDGLSRRDQDVELRRLVPVGADLDLVLAAVERKLLERAVEVVDGADEVAV